MDVARRLIVSMASQDGTTAFGGEIEMRALLSETPGGPESLKMVELPSRPLGKGQVRVAVRAAGVNFPDTLIIQDKYQFKPTRPFAPGHEIAGDITEVGEGVGDYKVGDRVIGMVGHGGYASEAVVEEGTALRTTP
jgi:NADPH:quinone reductase